MLEDKDRYTYKKDKLSGLIQDDRTSRETTSSQRSPQSAAARSHISLVSTTTVNSEHTQPKSAPASEHASVVKTSNVPSIHSQSQPVSASVTNLNSHPAASSSSVQSSKIDPQPVPKPQPALVPAHSQPQIGQVSISSSIAKLTFENLKTHTYYAQLDHLAQRRANVTPLRP